MACGFGARGSSRQPEGMVTRSVLRAVAATSHPSRLAPGSCDRARPSQRTPVHIAVVDFEPCPLEHVSDSLRGIFCLAVSGGKLWPS